MGNHLIYTCNNQQDPSSLRMKAPSFNSTCIMQDTKHQVSWSTYSYKCLVPCVSVVFINDTCKHRCCFRWKNEATPPNAAAAGFFATPPPIFVENGGVHHCYQLYCLIKWPHSIFFTLHRFKLIRCPMVTYNHFKSKHARHIYKFVWIKLRCHKNMNTKNR